MTWPTQREVPKFYGNPIGQFGVVNPEWKAENLVLVRLPYPMVLAWDQKHKVENVWFHWKAAKSLVSCLTEVRMALSDVQRAKDGLNLFGGTYTYRVMKGGHSLSMHAYGCAIDIDPEGNAYGSCKFHMPGSVVKIFEGAGWTWGGRWSTPDAMHFQAARVR